MKNGYEKLMDCLSCIRRKTDFKPEVAIVLGTGLGDYAKSGAIRILQEIPYNEIEGFPVSTVEGHAGKYILGYVGDVPVIAMQGRVHYYEGYAMSDVVLPVRLMILMGAGMLILTNASGGINWDFEPGDLMLITDQITSFAPSPLIGPNFDELGDRFPNMNRIYDPGLQTIVEECAGRLEIPLRKGIYLQTTGPQYETPAEIRMYRMLGADAVGMSTACEATAAVHMGARVCGISCVTNMAAGMPGCELGQEACIAAAARVENNFRRLITEVIKSIC